MENDQNISAQEMADDTNSVGSSVGQRIYNTPPAADEQSNTIAPRASQPAAQPPPDQGSPAPNNQQQAEPVTMESQAKQISDLQADLLKSNNRASLLHGMEDNPKAALGLLANHFGVSDFGASPTTPQPAPVQPAAPEFNIPEHNENETPAQYIKRALAAALPAMQTNMQTTVQPDQNAPNTPDQAQAQILAEQNKQRVIASMQYLDQRYDGWRVHEKEFIATLKQHPSLGQDLDKLHKFVMSGVTPPMNPERRTEIVDGKVNALNNQMVNVGDQRGSSANLNTTSQKPTLPTFDQAWQASKQALVKTN